eukprot:NODE_432_length_1751_cov_43.381316_g363_i0.p9 GENE.NODE_432_length_1751_cov_43.381316_g363_i0~~NODE_432_length_1751_cov_43.381316_g363_i0.p9  ORF type:complete len:56 (-),score=6.28 NODE_432_length_1751_cov_43.381316_g363_i0:430-597(-)
MGVGGIAMCMPRSIRGRDYISNNSTPNSNFSSGFLPLALNSNEAVLRIFFGHSFS